MLMSFDGLETPSATTDLDSEYEILGELGRGGMAIVYLARDRELGREVAIKVIRARFVEDEEAMARFAREARTVAQLHHPNVVTVHAVKRLTDGSLALVMQHISGQTLKEAIRREGPLSVDRIEQVLADVAEALGFAHDHGIVHRDVKPENILLDDSNGRALLFDFGIARSADNQTSLTLTGIALGTPAYMSPEQIDGAEVDGRSDLYSLGLVGWEMLTGQRPWDGEGLYSVIFKQKNEYLTPIQDLRPDAPARLRVAIEGALQKDRTLRWACADDFLAELTQGAAGSKRGRWRSSGGDRKNVIAAIAATREQRATEASPNTDTIRYRRAGAEPDAPAPPFAGVRRKRSGRSVRTAIAVVVLLLFGGGAIAVITGVQQIPFAEELLSLSSSPPATPRDAPDEPGEPALETPIAAGPDTSTDLAAGAEARMPPADSATSDTSEQGDSAVAGTPAESPEQVALDSPTEEPEDPPAASPTPPAAAPPEPTAREPVERESDAGNAGTRTASAPADEAAPGGDENVASAAQVIAITAGGMHSCVLASNGIASCWGGNDRGQLGTGGAARRSEPTRIVGDLRFRDLSAGVSHTCGIVQGGQAYCWGANDEGQLGDGTSSTRTEPEPVSGSLRFAELWSGMSHTCGVAMSGEAFCWGGNASGQIGDGSRTNRSEPSKIAAPTTLGRFALGWEHTCALTREGFAFCWGRNASGQLGDGSTTDRPLPSTVNGDHQFRKLTAGSAHTCGILGSSQALCWGRNANGQLGNGTTNNQTQPVAVEGGGGFVDISAGSAHTCGLAADGAVFCWGQNTYGQLGDGSTRDRSTPAPVAGDYAFATIDASGAHTCGITEAGERYCWGYNLEGQLGDGTRAHSSTPVRAET